MLSLKALLITRLSQLGDWWITAMRRLIPNKLLVNGNAETAFWEIIWQPDLQQFLLRYLHPSRQYPEHTWHADDDSKLSDDLLAKINTENQAVYLTVPARWFLQITVTLPVTAKADLASILRFELDKRTPFQPEHVFFASFPETTSPGATHFNCPLLIIPRNKLNNLLSSLAKKGLQPTLVSADTLDKQIPLLTDSAKRQANGFSQFKRSAPYWVLISFFVALYVPPYWQMQKIAGFETQIDDMRHAAVALQKQRSQMVAYRTDLTFLAAIKQDQQQLVVALEMLTKLLPNHTWVERLNISANGIVVLGESAEAAQLLPLLDKSNLFSSISFAAPITRNRQSGKDRFHLVLTLADQKVMP